MCEPPSGRGRAELVPAALGGARRAAVPRKEQRCRAGAEMGRKKKGGSGARLRRAVIFDEDSRR